MIYGHCLATVSVDKKALKITGAIYPDMNKLDLTKQNILVGLFKKQVP